MDFAIVLQNWPLLLEGLGLTLQLLLISAVAGLVLAVPVALAANHSNIAVNALPRAFMYFVRGTPLLVQMYLVYHGLGQFEAVRESFVWVFFKEAYWCALLAFSLNTAGYTAEILRGTINRLERGESEAAVALGMSPTTRIRRITLPSAFRRALPAYGNELVFMLHGTALAGVITLVDLFGAAKYIYSRHFVPFEAFIIAGLIYLVLTFIIVMGVKKLEKHWRVGVA